MKKSLTADDVDALLPQTQCGLCDYAGCRPYAAAIIDNNETIDRCPPGGTETLLALAKLLAIDPAPYIKKVQEQAKPPAVAFIQEATCIGCTKCIQACPTDAIIGAGKLMHTVISDACTGCELCLEPCPVDCIDMIKTSKKPAAIQSTQASNWRKRFNQRNARLQLQQEEKKKQHLSAKKTGSKAETLANRKAAIAAAIERVNQKKTRND